ncbi:MAG: benzoyl-CoA reductase, bzd-type, subunit Q [Betaproteobacteria bacterium]|nr:benzoyl-CoA reductase, bzd-type, subunit Q [Betaproteobacteria bacterium]
MLVCGIDVGARTGKAVLLADGELAAHSIIRTGPGSAATAVAALDKALETTAIRREDIEFTVATGYGRIVVPFSQRHMTEIACHAKGNHYFFPTVKTILDMGGQDCKAIRCDAAGKVTKFLMNDKCAAGTGRSIEVMAALLQVRLEDVGRLSMEANDGPAKISNTCVVFAKSEVLALARQGVPTSDILAGLCDGVAERVKVLLRAVGVEEDFVISGGISKNLGVVRRVEQKLGVISRICFEPQIVGALGAALFARDFLERKRSKGA